MANNLQTVHWTDDPVQQENFVAEVAPTIKLESDRFAGFYGVSMDREDIAQDLWLLKLCPQMNEKDPEGPFAKASPKEAADLLKANFKIREPIRSEARNLGKKQRRQAEIDAREEKARQAEIMAGVHNFDLPPDSVERFLAAARTIPAMAEASNLPAREGEAFRKESLRQLDLEGLPERVFSQITRAAGVPSSEQHAYDEYYNQHGRSSDSDRKAWYRALDKVRKVFDRTKFLSLLMILLALSLPLSLALSIHQFRWDHQEDIVNQGRSIHQEDLARGGNLSRRKTLSHQ